MGVRSRGEGARETGAAGEGEVEAGEVDGSGERPAAAQGVEGCRPRDRRRVAGARSGRRDSAAQREKPCMAGQEGYRASELVPEP